MPGGVTVFNITYAFLCVKQHKLIFLHLGAYAFDQLPPNYVETPLTQQVSDNSELLFILNVNFNRSTK